MANISQGAQANLNGKIFEDMCVPVFKNHGYAVFKETEVDKCPNLIKGLSRYVLTNAKYTTIYNEGGRTEFVIYNGDRKVRVENKYQSRAGSVDEKFVYTLLNAIEAYPEKEVIIVIDGGGYKPGARKWVQDRIDENWLNFRDKKDIQLFNIVEFIQWFDREMD